MTPLWDARGISSALTSSELSSWFNSVSPLVFPVMPWIGAVGIRGHWDRLLGRREFIRIVMNGQVDREVAGIVQAPASVTDSIMGSKERDRSLCGRSRILTLSGHEKVSLWDL